MTEDVIVESDAPVDAADAATEALSAIVEMRLQDRVPDAVLEECLDGMVEQLTDSPARPAAAKLATDQARIIVWFLEGIDSRVELLSWMRELAVQSLGTLDDEWFARIAADSMIVSALLGRPWGTLRADGIDDLPPDFAAELRRGIVVEDLLPAFRQAHKEFRWSAGERVEFLDDEENNEDVQHIDPREQQYPAMRPALGQLADRTEWALATLLEGFNSEDALLLWVQSTVAIVHAEVDEDAIRPAYFDREVREFMLADANHAEFLRTAWAAEYLLPAFNRAIRKVADRAGEVIAGEGEANQDPLGWKA